MAQTALHDANFVTKNLRAKQMDQKQAAYRPRRPVYVVTAGQKWAIVQDNTRLISGYRGWLARRRADLVIFKNFQPYKLAIKTWRMAQKMSDF